MAVTTFDGAKDHLRAHQELAVQVRFESEALDPIGHGSAQLLGLHCNIILSLGWNVQMHGMSMNNSTSSKEKRAEYPRLVWRRAPW